jgi:hypothetical protein
MPTGVGVGGARRVYSGGGNRSGRGKSHGATPGADQGNRGDDGVKTQGHLPVEVPPGGPGVIQADGSIVYPNPPPSNHPYNKRSVLTRLREEQAYNNGMAQLCMDRGFLNLALSHVMYAEELAAISQEMKKGN